MKTAKYYMHTISIDEAFQAFVCTIPTAIVFLFVCMDTCTITMHGNSGPNIHHSR